MLRNPIRGAATMNSWDCEDRSRVELWETSGTVDIGMVVTLV
jgi:hypothetical protein